MKSYGQFCSVARSLDLLGERWTLLIVRELLSGSTRFNDVRRGIPRISRTMLAARLRELLDAGVIIRSGTGPSYALTEAGQELASAVRDLGTWGQRWLPRTLLEDQLDVDALIWDIRRRIRADELPATPFVARLDITDGRRHATRFLLLRRSEVSLCGENPGFPEELRIAVSLRTLTAWWRGDIIADLAGRATPKSPLGKAVGYAIHQWPTLIVFLDDPRVPLSNAHVERQQRRTAIGRRNFLFAGSDDGARRFAMLHTLIVNCDLVGAPPFEYLRDIFGRLADDWPQARIRELLPAAWLADQRRQQQPADRAANAVNDVVSVVADAISAAA
jgi:DNA-binding HxlR family transcriptional regulator